MTVDIIAERNKRIKVLEAQRADDAATIKGLVKQIAELEDELRRRQEIIDDARIRMDDRLKRVESAEARVAELEAWYSASQESQRELLKGIALADRLASEVVLFREAEGLYCRKGCNGDCSACGVIEALAAYKAGEGK